MRQTTVKEFSSIRFGSGKFEVFDGIEWIDLGAMRDIKFEETWDKVTVMSDNAGEIVMGIRNHQAALSGSLMEISLAKLHVLRGGLDEYDEDPGSEVDPATQTVLSGNWAFGKFIKIEQQNHDLSEIIITKVEGNDKEYTIGDGDYVKYQDAAGNWGIIILIGGDHVDLKHHLTITYKYTPAAAKILKSGGKQTIDAVAVKVTNYDEDEKEFSITVHKATTEEGIVIDFPADDEEDPAIVPIKMVGVLDTDKEVGEQLFEISDAQNV